MDELAAVKHCSDAVVLNNSYFLSLQYMYTQGSEAAETLSAKSVMEIKHIHCSQNFYWI